jgi:hypothetical protein
MCRAQVLDDVNDLLCHGLLASNAGSLRSHVKQTGNDANNLTNGIPATSIAPVGLIAGCFLGSSTMAVAAWSILKVRETPFADSERGRRTVHRLQSCSAFRLGALQTFREVEMKRALGKIALSLTLAVAFSPVVFAQGGAGARGPAFGPPSFSDFDRNGDGVVTSAELESVRADRIAARSAAGYRMRGLANAPAFTDMDRNADGKLTAEEFAVYRQQRMRGPGGRPGCGGASRAGAPGGWGRGAMGGGMPTLADFDTNQDGLLTERELMQGRAERIRERSQQGYPMRNLANAPSFAAIDSNGDQRIDAQELANAQMQHRRMMMP